MWRCILTMVLTCVLFTDSKAIPGDPAAGSAGLDLPPGGTITFRLTQQQAREVEQLRLFRPAPEQLAVLRGAMPRCRNLLDVITERFQGCCCSRTSTAIWRTPGEVEVELGCLSPWAAGEERTLKALAANGDTASADELANPPIAPAISDSTDLTPYLAGRPASLIFDLRGDIYYEGRRVSDEEIVALLKDLERRHEVHSRTVILRFPPTVDPRDDMLRISRASELAVVLRNVGFALRCDG